MTTTVSASDEPAKVLISDNGAPGDDGDPGQNGTGLNNIRKSLLDNPLCHLFKTNKLAEVSAPTGTDSDVTWGRASEATYIDRYGLVKTAAIDEPREEQSGFLIEGESTNLTLWSEQFNNASWLKTGVTITDDNTSSPDGTITADKIEATLPDSFVRQLFSGLTIASSYTLSVWLRSDTQTNTSIFINEGGGDRSESAITVTSQWQRFTVSKTLNTASLEINIGGFTTFETGEVIYAWGAQLEQSVSVSSYIQTAVASVTRVADDTRLSYLNNFVFESPFTYFFNFNRDLDFDADMIIFSNENNDRPLLQIRSNGELRYFDDGGIYASGLPGVQVGTSFNAVTYDGVNINFYINGALINSVPFAPVVATALNETFIGQLINNVLNLNANLRDFRAYDFALNSDEIKFLSGQ